MADFITKLTISAIDKFSNVFNKINNSLQNTKTKATLLSLAMENLNKKTNTLGMASSNLFGKIRSLGLVVAGAGAGIFAMSKRSADAGENLLNASQRAGVSVESLQKLRYAAEIAGIDIGDMDNALKFLNKSLAEASTNSKSDAAKAFKSMHISLKGANGELKNADTVMLELADKFKNLPMVPKKWLRLLH
jgi:hypothetical protein